MAWISVLQMVLGAAPPIIAAYMQNKSNNKDDKRIIEVLEMAGKNKDDSRLLMENETKLLEVLKLILERMQVGGYPQVAGKDLGQLTTGRKNPKELDETLEMFWKAIGNQGSAYKDHERQQLSPWRFHQEATQGECSPCCDICCLKYNLKKRLPMVLRCGHTFCQQCIRNTMKQTLKCPVCQKISSEPFNDLPTNYEILKLIPQDEAVESHKTYPKGATAFSDSSDEDDDGLKKRHSARDRIREEFSVEEDDFGPSKKIPMGATGVSRSPDAFQVPNEQQRWEKEEDDFQLYSVTNRLRIMTTEEEEELDYAITKAQAKGFP